MAKAKKLKLRKVTVANFATPLGQDETNKIKGGVTEGICTVTFASPSCLPTCIQFTCLVCPTKIGYTCGGDTCGCPDTWCSECYTLRLC